MATAIAQACLRRKHVSFHMLAAVQEDLGAYMLLKGMQALHLGLEALKGPSLGP